MQLRTLTAAGISGAAAAAFALSGAGVANAYEPPIAWQPPGSQSEGNAITGSCGVHYRTSVDYNPDRPGVLTLNLQPLGTYGAGADNPAGCNGAVMYWALNWDNLPASRLPTYAQVNATKDGGPTISLDLPVGSGKVSVTAEGYNHYLIGEGPSFSTFYQVP
ncbi:MAG: hypothetical protein JWN03_6826 [Nocardia sp.]|uniref:hypothetical protein n=1 Tax=Nocardia sp. TaxID=1821 RepID=UPI00260680D6|nr:hypothetical protein [Nocardia sp.]MCU1646551.1 hypothetical protein [Nocardia sp.]